MQGADEMPLQEILQGLSRLPPDRREERAVLSVTAARWCAAAGDRASAVSHLEQALQVVPQLRPAMRALHRLYADEDDVRNAVLYLDQEIRATRHPREAAALYRERGRLVELHFRDLAAAQQCHEAALKATPDDLAVLRSVERVLIARGDIFGAIANIEHQLDVLKDEGAAAGLLHELARIEARHGGDLELALDLLLAALDAQPGHPGILADLVRTAEVARRPDMLLLGLEGEAEGLAESERATPLVRASIVLREHRERNAAVALLRAAALSRKDNFSLWRNLEELSMASSRYEVAMEALLNQVQTLGESDPGMRAELFYRIGRLAMMRLDRVNEGLAAMRKALKLFPGHVPAVEDTARYLIGHGLWAQLLELLRLQTSTATTAELTAAETAQTYLRTGQVLEEQINEPDGARQLYEQAAAIAPGYRPVRDRLERVLHQHGQPEALVEFYRAELERAEGSRRVFLLSILGQLSVNAGDSDGAIKYLVTLLKEVPEHLPSLQRLARLLARAGRTEDVLRVTKQEIKLTLSPVRLSKLQHRAGELALQLGDRDGGRELFQSALETVDDHQPSIASLEALLREDGDHPSLAALLRKRLLYANDRGRKVALRLEIANLLANELEQPEAALSELEQLLERWPRHLPALHAAETIATQLDQWELVTTRLEQHISAVSGPRTRAILLHRLAHVRAHRLGDPDGAIRELVRALELWPQLGVARALLLRLYEQQGRSRELQAFAEAGLTSERGADDRRAMALQLAELTPKPVVALQYLAAVAEARPEDFVTQLRLARAALAARRPSRAASAFDAAADQFSGELGSDDPQLLAIRYRAARAAETAGNLDMADECYARILDAVPNDPLAMMGRRRVKKHRDVAADKTRTEDLVEAQKASADAVQRAAFATIAAELHERHGDLQRALKHADEALDACPEYIPALHCRVRILERIGDDDHIRDAIRTLMRLVDTLQGSSHKVRALCRAGTIALRTADPSAHNEQAWKLFSQALELDPTSDVAVRGLQRTLTTHGTHGAPQLAGTMQRRLEYLGTVEDGLRGSALRTMARLLDATDGPTAAVKLLEAGMKLGTTDAGIHTELAQGYAKLGRWREVVGELENALGLEPSPERAAALHYFAADAEERAGTPGQAVPHYIAAGRGGFHPVHALLSADRIAAKTDDLDQRVEALQLLVELGDGEQRIRSLRALADLHRGPLAKPDLAVDLMRELLLLSPTDLGVLKELQRLLIKLDRSEEATAALLAGVAHHRAWLRASGVRGDTDGTTSLAPVEGLRELFELLGDADGVLLATAILEVISGPAFIGRTCDQLVTEPWVLPNAQDGRPLDLLVGDLPISAVLDLLQEATFMFKSIPGAAPPPVDLSPSDALPASSGVVMVTRALADALGVRQPNVFIDPNAQDTVVAVAGATPALVVGRRINQTPFAPRARDRIGRALLRLATGGDYLHREASDAEILGVLHGIATATGIELSFDSGFDKRASTSVEEQLAAVSGNDALRDVKTAATAVAALRDDVSPARLRKTLAMATDRAGVVSAADPRPALERLMGEGLITDERGTALVGYLLSDDHLGLRKVLGYLPVLELDDLDIEEVES